MPSYDTVPFFTDLYILSIKNKIKNPFSRYNLGKHVTVLSPHKKKFKTVQNWNQVTYSHQLRQYINFLHVKPLTKYKQLLWARWVLVSWCFEPSQPHRVKSGIRTRWGKSKTVLGVTQHRLKQLYHQHMKRIHQYNVLFYCHKNMKRKSPN